MCMKFDGVDDYVNLNISNYLTTSAITLMAWGLIEEGSDGGTSDSNFPHVWGCGTSGSSGRDWQCYWNTGGDWTFRFRIAGSQYDTKSASINANTWYHLAVTYDGSTIKTYTNGSYSNQTTGLSGSLDAPDAGRIGSNPYLSPRELKGCVTDFRVYERALNPEEIEEIYILRGADTIVQDMKGRFVLLDGAPGTSAAGMNIADLMGYTASVVGAPTFEESILRGFRRQAQ